MFHYLPTIRRLQCRITAIDLKSTSRFIIGLPAAISRVARISAAPIIIIIARAGIVNLPTSISTGPGRSAGALMRNVRGSV
jgi:hypothetical protein